MVRYKRLNLHDFKDVYKLQEIIYNDLEDKSWYRFNSESLLYTRLGTASSFAIGAYLNDELIATGMLVVDKELTDSICSVTDCNLGDIVLILVKNEYRGIGLQKSLMTKLEHHALEYGFEYTGASVHPDNIYCRNNIIELGYTFDHTDILFEGLLREVYIKKL